MEFNQIVQVSTSKYIATDKQTISTFVTTFIWHLSRKNIERYKRKKRRGWTNKRESYNNLFNLTQTSDPWSNSKPYSFSIPVSCGWSSGSSLPPHQFKALNQLQNMATTPAPISYAPIKPSNNICPSNLSHTPTTNEDEDNTLKLTNYFGKQGRKLESWIHCRGKKTWFFHSVVWINAIHEILLWIFKLMAEKTSLKAKVFTLVKRKVTKPKAR